MDQTLETKPSKQAVDSSKCAESNRIYGELIAAIRAQAPDADLSKVEKAYDFAAFCHREQRRKSGEPYITHPLEVAIIVTGLKLDLDSIVAAILHDTVEDTESTLEDIEREFGPTVRELVDGLTKIGKIKFRSTEERMAENFRKMVLAMAKDLRIILIKLCDRMHNMRTLDHMPVEKRRRIAQETLDIYAPLANRLGIYGIKSELEDLCMRQLKIEVYRDIAKKIAAKKAERETYIEEVKTIVEQELKKYGFKNLIVYGRPKHFFSIYKKMVDRGLEFEDIHDLFAFRIIVESVKDCYEALGVIHAMWKPMPGRFKDYIAMPKANMYQSLHTTVIRPNGEPAEFQIRTHEMNQTCEYGVAAHWAYKERNSQASSDATDLKRFSWLRQIMEWQNELKDPGEFLEAVKVDLYQEEIFIFTPKGDVIQLPSGATALDFAFSVHSEVGITTVGAKVNGRMVPIKRNLASGDIVEILTSPHQRPGKDWLNWVTTSKARNKIRSVLRAEQRDRSRKLGQDLLTDELDKRGIDPEKAIKMDLAKFTKAAREAHIEDVYVAIGYGKQNAKDLVDRVYPPKAPNKSLEEQSKELSSALADDKNRQRKKAKQGILVHGIENVLVNFARCCNPLPGEEVTGFITRGRGVTVHRSSCPRALDMDPHRKVEVQWADEDLEKKGSHAAYLRVNAMDRSGVLAEVTTAISNAGANIKKAQIRVTAELTGVLDFEITLNSLTQLRAIIQKIESLPYVISVERIGSGREG